LRGARLGIGQQDANSTGCCDLRDAAAHGAGADHANQQVGAVRIECHSGFSCTIALWLPGRPPRVILRVMPGCEVKQEFYSVRLDPARRRAQA
jgi:hypothetical protein